MHRTIHEALELRDLITECEIVAAKLVHAAASCRDAGTVQMLAAHQRAFQQHAHQLRQALGAAAPAGGPVGGFGAPPFPPMRGGAHDEGGGPGHRETRHHGGKGNAESRFSGRRMEAGPGETQRADRPELVGWEPGAGNNEGWQAGARREDPRHSHDAAGAIRAGRDAGDTRFEASAPLAPQVGTAGEREAARRDATGRGSAGAEAFTAVRPPGQPFSFAARQDAPASGPGAVRVPSGGAGHRPEASPRVDFAPGVGAGSVPYASPTGYRARAGHAPRPDYAPRVDHTPQAVQTTSAGIADPDALAVADCLKDCKHIAVRLVMAAAECADHHLRRTLHQMAGEHLEMAGQHFEWLQRRHLYNVEGAGPQLVRSLEQDIRRLEEAVRVTPPGGPQESFGPWDFRH